MSDNVKKRVGILRGGAGKHYESSLRKGGEIISHILENLSDKYKTIDILIDKEGVWHINGIPIKPADLMHKVDIVWNTSRHPGSTMALNSLAIPNIGDASFLGFSDINNDILRAHIKNIGIRMPKSIISPRNAREVFEKFSSPWIVKINNEIRLAKTFNELAETIKDKNNVIIEEFILGRVFSVHSLTGFRGEDVYVFPPKDFATNEKEKIITLVKDLHKHLGVKHYLKSDLIFHPKKGFFLTSVDFSPDFRKGSHFEQSCQYVGAEIYHIIEHILEKRLS
jgi:D-alanine-D-alanine ligase-like ATP-grasp enzyme